MEDVPNIHNDLSPPTSNTPHLTNGGHSPPLTTTNPFSSPHLHQNTTPSKVIKGEIHNVLSIIRTSPRYATPLRFQIENAHSQHPLLTSLHSLSSKLTLAPSLVDCVTYLSPFVSAIISREISGSVTGAALGSLHKFLLYGFITPEETPRAKDGITLIARCIRHCTFEEMSSESSISKTSNAGGTTLHQDEEVVMKLLSLSALVMRCEAGKLLDPPDVVGVFETCLHVTCNARSASRLLRSSAGDALKDIVLVVFGREEEREEGEEEFEDGSGEEDDSWGEKDPTTEGEEFPQEGEDGERRLKDVEQEETVDKSNDENNNELPSTTDHFQSLSVDENVDQRKIRQVQDVQNKTPNDKSTNETNQQSSSPNEIPSPPSSNEFESISSLDTIPIGTPPPPPSTTSHNSSIQPAPVTLMHRLTTLLSPLHNPLPTSALSLSLINIALETSSPSLLTSHPTLIHILQNDLCKHLLQLSTTSDLVIFSLTLRVIFNLFNSLRNHLKVQLEVFLTSVHLRILEKETLLEQKEIVLESLLEFCHEPALMHDLYMNFDCDFQCTNLFERICTTLTKMACPSPNQTLNVLNRLAVEGMLAVLDSIARRCRNAPHSFCIPHSESQLSDTESSTASDSWMDDARHRTSQILLQRKRKKHLLSLVSSQFNKNPSKEWLTYGESLGVLPTPATAKSIASFLYSTPNLDKTNIGLYLSKGPNDKYPFHAQVLGEFVRLFDFSGLTFSEALRTFLRRFRLPGEAQCIDRLMEAFASHLHSQTPSFFGSADAVFILAFSTIMLNTDLHNPNIAEDRKMTLEQFVKNNRGINEGEDLPREFLEELYGEILGKEIEVEVGVEEVLSEEGGILKWDGLLTNKSKMTTPFFSTPPPTHPHASLHEKDMFTSLSQSALQCISTIFCQSWDDALVVKTLTGFRQMALISGYFEMNELLNDILCILLGYGREYIQGRDGMMGEEQEEDNDWRGEYPIPHALLETDPTNSSNPLEESDVLIGSAAHRGLLSLHCAFTLLKTQTEQVREAWPEFMECLFALRDVNALPSSLAELDDFADCRGEALPSSMYARKCKRMVEEVLNGGMGGEEEQREQTDGFWGNVILVLKPFGSSQQQKQDGNGTESSSFLAALLSVSRAAQFELILMRSKDLPLATQILRALLDARDPESLTVYDPLFEHHAVFALELAARALLSNQYCAVELFPMFQSRLEGILKVEEGKGVLMVPYLMERAVVTVLRACIYLYDVPEMRPHFFSCLQLLPPLPPTFIQHIIDRLACGMAILLLGCFFHLQTQSELSTPLTACTHRKTHCRLIRGACRRRTKMENKCHIATPSTAYTHPWTHRSLIRGPCGQRIKTEKNLSTHKRAKE